MKPTPARRTREALQGRARQALQACYENEFIPALPTEALCWLAGDLGPAERRALRVIVDEADIVEIDGRAFLVAPVTAEVVDTLAAFEAEGEDREPDLEDEPGEDPEPDEDREPGPRVDVARRTSTSLRRTGATPPATAPEADR